MFPTTTVLAQEINPVWPGFLNQGFITGLLATLFVMMVVFAILKMTPDAHKQDTGKMSAKLLNYGILAFALVLVISGGIWAIANTAEEELLVNSLAVNPALVGSR